MWTDQRSSPAFVLFKTPVYFHPSYLILVVLLGLQGFDDRGVIGLILVVGAATLSLLIHEFGHVYAARTNGFRASVMLLGFGGVTIPSGQARGLRYIWMSAAGPLFGLAAWALLWFGYTLSPFCTLEQVAFDGDMIFSPGSVYWIQAMTGDDVPLLWFWSHLCFMNLYWSLLNLVPVFPLDGGQILHEFLRMRMRAVEAERISAIVGLVLGIGCAFALYHYLGSTFGPVIFGLLAWQNWSRLQRA